MAVSSLLQRFKSPTISSVWSLAIRKSNPFSFSTQCFVRRTASISVPTESPPVPKNIPFAVSTHGVTRQDPYRWMRNTDDTDFLDYLQRENSYAQAFMADTETLRRDLVFEMKARIPAEISTPPERWGPWLYRQYIPKGKEYPLLCRRLERARTNWLSGLFHGQEEEEEVVLDWNKIAEQYGYVHVGVCRVSPDHNYLAYTVDPKGDERFLLQIKDLTSGRLVPRLEVDGVVSLAWALDGITLFYTLTDDNQRPHRVVVTNVESDGTADAVVFSEKDSSFCVDITTTKDGKFVTINSNSRISSEVYIINADKPLAGFVRTRKRVPGVQCFLEHHNGFFYILINAHTNATSEWSGEGYYLTRCLVEEIESSEWQTVFCPDDDVVIQDMDMFSDYLVLFLNKKGLPMLCSIDMPVKGNMKHLEDLNPWFFPLPADPCSVAPGSNHNFQSSIYRVVLSSPVIPDTIIDYDVSRRSFSIVQQGEGRIIDDPDSSTQWYSADHSTENSGERNDRTNEGQSGQLDSRMPKWEEELADKYVCERQEVSSHDRVEVPLTILYSREAWKKSESPGILIGYGAYGEALDKSWCTNRLSMLDRGWVIAFADVRGGGGGDFSWHKSGTGSLKLNSIQDFIYSAKYLIDKGYVHRHHLAAIGYSAGSILPAAAMNMHPGLFQAAILKVPFVDVLNTLSDSNLPLTLLDHEEFGNPNIQTDFRSILCYSPYDNIRRDVCYPSMLVTTSFHDSRVGVWEGAKWVAKIRESTCHDCSRAVILRTNMSGGHFGEGGRYAQCEETAFDYAFLIKVMGYHNNREHNHTIFGFA